MGKRGFFNFIKATLVALCLVFASNSAWAYMLIDVDNDGGTGGITSLQYDCEDQNQPFEINGTWYYYDQTVPSSVLPTKTGYTFNGYTDTVYEAFYWMDDSGLLDGQSVDAMVSSSICADGSNDGEWQEGHVYAQWTPKSITCAKGKYLPANSENCAACPAGRYCSGGTWTYDGTEKGNTGNIAAGYFSTGGAYSSTPNTVVGGQSGTGSNGCISGYSCGLVSAGRYTGGAGTSANGHGPVAAGYYSTGGAGSATPNASAGAGGGTSNSWNTCRNNNSCGLVAAGRYSTGGATTAQGNGAVLAGFYSTGGATREDPAFNGNGCTGTGQTCGFVSAGYFNTGGGTSATPNSTVGGTSGNGSNGCLSGYTCGLVSAGYYNAGGGFNATGGNNTAGGTVNAGYFCSGGCTSATPNNTVGGANGNGSNGCVTGQTCGLLSAGRYGSAGATTNQGSGAVSKGYYSTGGATTATPMDSADCTAQNSCGICRADSTTTGTGATSINDCLCIGGKYLVGNNCATTNAGNYSGLSNTQTPCANGTYSAAGASSCTPCATGYSNTGTGNSSCTANKYTIYFDGNDGIIASGGTTQATATYNAAMPSIVTNILPTRTGYTFAGYYDTNAATGGTQYYTNAGASARSWNKTSNTTLYARWTPNTYTVTYKAGQGGVGADVTQSVTYMQDFTSKPANTFRKDNATFNKWSANVGGTLAADTTIKYPYAGNMVLTATWNCNTGYTLNSTTGNCVANTYTVVYNKNAPSGVTVNGTMANSSHTYGVAKALTTNAYTANGYMFMGWATSSSATTANYTDGQSVTNLSSTNGATVNLYAVWKKAEFTLTTTSTNSFQFKMSAAGMFYVDCGNGGTLKDSSNNNLNGVISRANTTEATYTCSWASSAAQTIRFGGAATDYSTGTSTAAISFYTNGTNAQKVYSISGDLGKIFGAVQSNRTPRFYQTFSNTAITAIPSGLFSSIVTSSSTYTGHMFQYTFDGCSKLSTIPSGLFSSIDASNATNTGYMFYGTFQNCSNLTAIPSGLFSSIDTSSATDTLEMFSGTFQNCSNLTAIPSGLFNSINTSSATYTEAMFYNTFSGCTKLSSIPSGLFSGVTGTTGEGMFANTFAGCTSLTSIPADMFSGVTRAQPGGLYETFAGCTNLASITDGQTSTSYVPGTFLSGVTADSSGIDHMFSGTALASSCPAGTYTTTPSTFSNAGKPWCTPCAAGTYTSSAGQSSCSACGTGYSNSGTGNTSCSANTYTITLDDTTNGGSGGTGTAKEVYNTKWTNNSGTTITSVTIPTKSKAVFLGYYTDATGGTQKIPASGVLPATTTWTSNATVKAQFANCTCNKGTGVKTCTAKSVSSNKCTYDVTYENGYYGAATQTNNNAATASYTATASACTNKPSNTHYTGAASSDSCAWECDAGYYGSSAAGSSSCEACGTGNYCTGGTNRVACSTVVNYGGTTPDDVHIFTMSSGNWSDNAHAATITDCMCDFHYHDESTASYMNERSCTYGPGGNNYRYYSHCRTGYYASDPLNWGNWYTSCSACTNKPANATYTSYSTPSTMYAVESNCPWQCPTGYSTTGKKAGATTGTGSSSTCSAIDDYSITYNMNSGTNYSGAPGTYKYGVGATINGMPTRSGYVFKGWCDDSGLTSNCAMTKTISTSATGDKTFYAKWESASCSNSNASVATATLTGVTGNAPVCTVVCAAGYYGGGTGKTGTAGTATFTPTCSACSGLGTGYTSDQGQNATNASCYLSLSGKVRSGTSGITTSDCNSGKYKASNTKQYYGTSYSCDTCAAGTYSATSGAITSCTACAIGSYSSAGASSCTACPGGKTTSGTGTAFNTNANTTCSTSCSSIANLATWATPSWSANSVSNLCTVSTCNACAKVTGVASCTYNTTGNKCNYTATCYTGYNSATCSGKNCSCSPNISGTITLDYGNNPNITNIGYTSLWTRYNTGVYASLADAQAGTNEITELNSIPEWACHHFVEFQDARGNWLINDLGEFQPSLQTLVPTSGGTNTITAIWEEYPLVNLYKNGGTGGVNSLHLKIDYYDGYNNATKAYTDSACATPINVGGGISTPTRTGYNFGGYYCNSIDAPSDSPDFVQEMCDDYSSANGGKGTLLVDASGNLTNNMVDPLIDCVTWDQSTTCYADWTPITYTITYNLNSGSNPSGVPTTYNIETNTITLPTPTRTGYTFAGWYENSSFSGTAITQIAKGSTGNKTFYAKWTANTYTVVYNKNAPSGKTVNGTTANSSHTYGVAKALTPNGYTLDGYIFAGWATSSGGDPDLPDGYSVSNLSSTNGATVNLYAIWIQEKFLLTTTSTNSFKFSLSATGGFAVDCGDGGTLKNSTNDYIGNIILRSNTTKATYTCTWDSNGEHTIRLGGGANASGYNSSVSIAAISFYDVTNSTTDNIANAIKIKSIPEGSSLSALFPGGPIFYRTFSGATNLTSIPDTLFENYSTASSYMFYHTFEYCSGLTSVSAGLFGNITGASMESFAYTFYGCSNLQSVPAGLFGNIKFGDEGLFEHTFDSTGLTTIPEGLFGKITRGQGGMFAYTFKDCKSLTSIPVGLFSSITTPADYNFIGTFQGCSNLVTVGNKNYIPSTFLSNVTSGNNVVQGMFTDSGLPSSCPAGTHTFSKTQTNGAFANAGKPWCEPCAAGTYTSTSGNNSCTQASAGYYVSGTEQTSQTACTTTTGWTTTSPVGSTSYTACYQTQTPSNCASGTIKRTASSISGTTITYGSASVTSALSANAGYYVNSIACSACGGNNYYCPGGTTARQTVSSGYYSTGGDSNTRSGQSKCPGSTYCTGGVKYDCPTANSSTIRTTYPESYHNPTSVLINNQDWYKGLTALNQCRAYYVVTNSRGQFTVDSVKYNTTSGKYDIDDEAKYYQKINPGYYGDTKYSSTYCNSGSNVMIYQDALPCPEGSYCPGLESMPLCSSGTYQDTIGITSCPSAYPNSAAGTTTSDNCYLSTDAKKYVATAGAGQTDCVAGTYCAGGTTIYYGGTHSSSHLTTGGSTQCPAGSFCVAAVSAATACSTLTGVSPSGGTYASAAGSTASTACKYTAPSKTITGCATVTSQQVTYSGSAWPASTYGVTANAGYVIANNNKSNATCTQCTGATFSAGGTATQCSSCPTAEDTWTQGSGTGWSAVTQCFETKAAPNCKSGTLQKNATNTTTWGSSAIASALTAYAGSYVNGQQCSACGAGTYTASDNTKTSCDACSGATQYQDGTGATSCKNVSAGYYKSSNSAQAQCPVNYQSGAGASSQSGCTASCSATTAITTANGACTTQGTGYWAKAHTVTYGNTSVLNTDYAQCPANYRTGAVASSQAGCSTSCSAGYAVLSANGACTSIQNATYKGKYIGQNTVTYGNTSTINSCPANYQAANGTTAQSNCETACSAGTQVASATAVCSTPQGNTWYSGAHNVKYGSTSGSNVKSCVTGYNTANTTTATDHDAENDCKISCGAGTWVASARSTCGSVGDGYYTTTSQTISQGSIGSRSACSALKSDYTHSDNGRDATTDCFLNTTKKKYVATATENQVDCAEDGYCPGGTKIYYNSIGGRTACGTGLFAPAKSYRPEQCGHKFHVDGVNFNDVIYLHSDKVTTPSFNVRWDNKTWYANMTETPTNMSVDSSHKFKASYNGKTYYVCDDTICDPNNP